MDEQSETLRRLKEIAGNELEKEINENGESFSSACESYAYILKQLKECEESIEEVKACMNGFWRNIRAEELSPQMFWCSKIYEFALDAAEAALILAASAKKSLNPFDK